MSKSNQFASLSESELTPEMAEFLAQNHAPTQLAMHSTRCVTAEAHKLHWCAQVFLTEEVFESCVTARPHASSDDLTPYERARLLDLLVHAMPWVESAKTLPSQFKHWFINSDARTPAPRCMLIQLELTEEQHFLLSFFDSSTV